MGKRGRKIGEGICQLHMPKSTILQQLTHALHKEDATDSVYGMSLNTSLYIECSAIAIIKKEGVHEYH